MRETTIESQIIHVPDDWKLGKLADFGVFRSGNGFPLAFQGDQSGDLPFFKVSDLSGEGNQLFMNNANHYISEGVRKKLGAIRFEPGSIVFAKIGAAIFLERKRLLTQESCLDNNMMAFTLTDEFGCPRFFHYLFQRIEIGKFVSTTALPALSGKHVGAVSVLIPPLVEQRTIAEVLSDVDGLINALETLIAKKRAIKQATMQQLLTGEARLSGFSGVWETKRVLEFGDVITGATPSTKVDSFWNGTYPWITPTDITSNRDMSVSERMITQEGLNAIRTLPPNTVLVTCIASIGKNAILRTTGSCNQQINAVTPNSAHSVEFLYYLFEFNTKFLLANAGITATNIVSKAAFSKLVFEVPPFEEQRSIAAVLSDMDAEITALEKRRDKTIAIKRGMMQQLLTGKMRLPVRSCTDDADDTD